MGFPTWAELSQNCSCMQKINVVYRSTLIMPPLPRFSVCHRFAATQHKSELFPAQRGCFLLRVLPLSSSAFPWIIPSSTCTSSLGQETGVTSLSHRTTCPSHAHFTCQRGDPCALGREVVHVGLRNQKHLVGGLWCEAAELEAGESPRELLAAPAARGSCWPQVQGVVTRVLGQQPGPLQTETARGDVCGVEPLGLDGIWKGERGQKSLLAATARAGPSPSAREGQLAAPPTPETTELWNQTTESPDMEQPRG